MGSWICIIFVSTNWWSSKNGLYAYSRLLWIICIHTRYCCCFAWTFRKSFLRNVNDCVYIQTFAYNISTYRKADYAQMPNQAVMINCIGGLIVTFSGLIVFLATNEGYRRAPLPEDAMLLIGHDE